MIDQKTADLLRRAASWLGNDGEHNPYVLRLENELVQEIADLLALGEKRRVSFVYQEGAIAPETFPPKWVGKVKVTVKGASPVMPSQNKLLDIAASVLPIYGDPDEYKLHANWEILTESRPYIVTIDGWVTGEPHPDEIPF